MQDYGRTFIGPMTMKKSSGGYVDARAYGNVGNQTAITLALADIGTDNRTLYLAAGTWNITSDLTIPTNVTLDVEDGVLFEFTTGKKLTINGYMRANLNKIASTVGLEFTSQKIVYPEWWGAEINNNVVDAAAAINLAIAAIPNGGVIELQVGTYYFGSTVNLISDLEFRGYGGIRAAGTELKRVDDIIMFSAVGVAYYSPEFNMNQIYRNTFRGISVNGWAESGKYTSHLFKLLACAHFVWEDCQLSNSGTTVYAAELFDSRFNDVYLTWSGDKELELPVIDLCSDLKDGEIQYTSTNNIYFDGCIWESNVYTCIRAHGLQQVGGVRSSMIYFTNCKLENLTIKGPTLKFEHAWLISFVNTFVIFSDIEKLDEVIYFKGCSHIEGALWLSGAALAPEGSQKKIKRIITIITKVSGDPSRRYMCRANLFISGSQWSMIDEDAIINIDDTDGDGLNQSSYINIKSYGPTEITGTTNAENGPGWFCGKKLTNRSWDTGSIFPTAIRFRAPAGKSLDWMMVMEHALTAGGMDTWSQSVYEDTVSSTMQFALNDKAILRLISELYVQVASGDLFVSTPGKGIVLTNSAGQTARISLNDTATGLKVGWENPIPLR
jgi:hypothetical protein